MNFTALDSTTVMVGEKRGVVAMLAEFGLILIDAEMTTDGFVIFPPTARAWVLSTEQIAAVYRVGQGWDKAALLRFIHHCRAIEMCGLLIHKPWCN